MREYEAMVILNASLEDEKIEESIAKIEKMLKKGGSEIEKSDKWGKRRLAYPIKKEASGYYCLFYFKGEADQVKEYNRVLRISDEVLRHTIFRKGD